MTAAASRSPRSPWKAAPTSPRTRGKPSTTPSAFPTLSPSQSAASRLSPNPATGRNSTDGRAKSPNVAAGNNATGRSVSPSYFGLVVEPGSTSPVDSDAGVHAKSNWKSPSSSFGSQAAASPQPVPHDDNPDLADFRRQSEAYAFSLGNLHRFHTAAPAASSPLARTAERSQSAGFFPTVGRLADAKRRQEDAQATERETEEAPGPTADEPAAGPTAIEDRALQSPRGMLDSVRSPGPEQRLSHIDERQHRLSLTENRVHQPPPPPAQLTEEARAQSMPQNMNQEGPRLLPPQEFADLYDSDYPDNLLLLDLRVAPQYAKSRVKGALNLCIPTTLLKRPSFSVPRLSDAFTQADEKARFARWPEVQYIVVHDANSASLRDATAAVNTVKKFLNEGWSGTSYIIRGGFQALAKETPRLVEKSDGGKGAGLNKKGLTLQPEAGVQVAGGCPMPATKTAANPFFGNIRQNMDLIGGVGQLEIALPEAVNPRTFDYLPPWLQRTAAVDDKGKAVADTFLEIERTEQRRMQAALSGDVHYGTPQPGGPDAVQMAGIEKGTKNRYKDILPFEHSRVKLQNVDANGCDYINASHVKAEWSDRHYIATQAPVAATFEDFWRLIWDQDVRVVVMLTAVNEGGQQKAHPYWITGDYGPMKVKALSEKKVALVPPSSVASKVRRAQLGSPTAPPVTTRRRGVTNPLGLAPALQEQHGTPGAPPATGGHSEADIPHVVVRKLTLSHSASPFEPIREVTQLHFAQWPDFGTISAQDVLGLVEQCNAVTRVRNHAQHSGPTNPVMPVPADEHPLIVHCSAGCGRTGTFCVIDSVLDMLKRQRLAKNRRAVAGHDAMDVDEPAWVTDEVTDLIAKAVEDFRQQRISMVQTLRQYVLCYEAVAAWWVKQHPDKFLKDHARRSSQG